MAEKINYKLNLDTGNAPKNMGQLQSRLNDLKKQIKDTDFGSKKFKELQEEIKQTDSQLETMGDSIRGISKADQFENMGRNVDDLTQGIGDMASGFAAAGIASDDFEQSLQQTVVVAQTFKGAGEAASVVLRNWPTIAAKATTATRALNSAIRANPYTALVTAIGAVVAGIGTYLALSEDTEKQQKELNEEFKTAQQLNKENAEAVAEERTELTLLLSEIESTNKGTRQREDAIEQLNKDYGKYIENLRDEKGELKDINIIRNEVIDGLRAEGLAKQNNEKITKILADQRDRESNSVLRNSISYNDLFPIINRFQELKKQGLEQSEIRTKLLENENELTEEQARVVRYNLSRVSQLVNKREEDNEKIQELIKANKELSDEFTNQTEKQEDNTEEGQENNRMKEINIELNEEILRQWDEFANKEGFWEKMNEDLQGSNDRLRKKMNLQAEVAAGVKSEEQAQREMVEFEKDQSRTRIQRFNKEIVKLEQKSNLTKEEAERLKTLKALRKDELEILTNQQNKLDQMDKQTIEAGDSISSKLSTRITKAWAESNDKSIKESREMQRALTASFDKTFQTGEMLMDHYFSQQKKQIRQTKEMAIENAKDRAEREKNILKDQLEDNVISQQEYDNRLKKIQRERRLREWKAEKRAFEQKQKLDKQRAVMNGAVAATRAFADYSWPYNLVVAGIIAGQTAAEVAIIENQEPPRRPQFEQGGIVQGPSHRQGGVPIEAEGGEVILNRNVGSDPALRQMASNLNEASGGQSFESNTQGPSTSGGQPSDSSRPIKAYVVESEISDKQKTEKRRRNQAKF